MLVIDGSKNAAICELSVRTVRWVHYNVNNTFAYPSNASRPFLMPKRGSLSFFNPNLR